MSASPLSDPPAQSSIGVLLERVDRVRAAQPDLAPRLSEIAAEIPQSRAARSLAGLAAAIEAGQPSVQLAQCFPEHVWLLTIQSSARRAEALHAMLEQSAHQNRVRARRLRAVAYPAVLLAVGIVILMLACGLLVPSFDEMYQEFQIRLPPPTAWLLGLSRFIVAHPLAASAAALAVIVALAAALWWWLGIPSSKASRSKRGSNEITLRQALAKACLQLAELGEEGVALSKSLLIAAASSDDPLTHAALSDVAQQMEQSPNRVSQSRGARVLPPNLMFALFGEVPTLSRDGGFRGAPQTALLRELSTIYRADSVRQRDWVSVLVGQLAIVTVGLLIGLMVIALFFPLVTLITALS